MDALPLLEAKQVSGASRWGGGGVGGEVGGGVGSSAGRMAVGSRVGVGSSAGGMAVGSRVGVGRGAGVGCGLRAVSQQAMMLGQCLEFQRCQCRSDWMMLYTLTAAFVSVFRL